MLRHGTEGNGLPDVESGVIQVQFLLALGLTSKDLEIWQSKIIWTTTILLTTKATELRQETKCLNTPSQDPNLMQWEIPDHASTKDNPKNLTFNNHPPRSVQPRHWLVMKERSLKISVLQKRGKKGNVLSEPRLKEFVLKERSLKISWHVMMMRNLRRK